MNIAQELRYALSIVIRPHDFKQLNIYLEISGILYVTDS